MGFFYTSLSGERVRQFEISSVPRFFIPYVGWVCNLHSQTFTVETRVSFDGGSTWTVWTTVNNRDQLPDYFNDTLVERTDLVEVRQSFSSTDNTESPVLESFFIYFPDFEPYIDEVLPSLDLDLTIYNHVDIGKSDFPLMTLSIDPDESYLNRTGDMELEFNLLCEIHAGYYLEADLPALTSAFEVAPGYVADVSSILPSFEIDMDTGGIFSGELPAVSLEAEISHLYPAYFLCTLPLLIGSFSASRASEGDISAAMPVPTYSMAGKNGEVAAIFASLSKIPADINCLHGNVVYMESTMPKVKVTIKSIRTGENDIATTTPSFNMLIQSGQVSSDALRYVKGKVR